MISEHDIEEWKPVQLEGYEKYYEVSSFGNVRSVRSGKLLSQWTASRMEYWAVQMQVDNRVTKQYVHRLVLLTFVGPCPEGMESCHGEKGKDVNRVDNLRWGTRLSNSHDLDIHGTRQFGSKHHQAILTEKDVMEIRNSHKKWGDRTRLAKEYNVSPSTIGDIVNGKTWKNLPE